MSLSDVHGSSTLLLLGTYLKKNTMSAPLETYSLFCQLVNKVLQQGDQSSEQEMNKTESAQFKAMCSFKYSSLGNYNITQKCS